MEFENIGFMGSRPDDEKAKRKPRMKDIFVIPSANLKTITKKEKHIKEDKKIVKSIKIYKREKKEVKFEEFKNKDNVDTLASRSIKVKKIKD
jgi:1,2-phenylacetyl-CoA epoxidase PaaB subunit